MNIIVNGGTKVIKFSETKVGDCFGRNGHVYLKTITFCDCDDHTEYNAINLDGNCFDFFCSNVDVIKVNATLSINYNMEE